MLVDLTIFWLKDKLAFCYQLRFYSHNFYYLHTCLMKFLQCITVNLISEHIRNTMKNILDMKYEKYQLNNISLYD